MKACTNAYTVAKKGSYFSVMIDSAEARILLPTDSILRIRAGSDDDLAEGSYSLVMIAQGDRMDDFLKGCRIRVEAAGAVPSDGDREVVIEGHILKAVVEKNPFRICVYDEEDILLYADIVDLVYMEDGNYRWIHTSEISPEDCFYGFGEKSDSLNKAQKFMSTSPKDAMGYGPRETDSPYKHIPFHIKLNRGTRKAVGYFYHNTRECDSDTGRERSNCWKPHSRYRTDGGGVDPFLITGPFVRQVMERYTSLTGKSAMLPRYAPGYLGSSTYYSELDNDCDDAILDFIDTTREEKILVNGLQLFSGYCTVKMDKGTKCYVSTWNKERFKDFRESLAQMEKGRVTVSPNVKPGILLIHPKLDETKAKGMFIKASDSDESGIGTWWSGKGAFVDFTGPSTRTHWKGMLKKNALEHGTSSAWNDNCEYDSLVDKDCRCDPEGKGGTTGQLKSVMSSTICHITDEVIHETSTNTCPYIICRSGHCGIQRYAQTWTGNNLICWDSLKYNTVTILGMSLSGVVNQGCDISGFYGPSPEAELMVHRIQNGIFQPRFSIHSTNIDNTMTEPWMYGDCTDCILKAIGLRYQLSPHLYSPMGRAYETGLSVMEPMCSTFQEDVKCYEEGVDLTPDDSLLVVNVVEKGAVSRKAYLLEGETFCDFHTGAAYEDGRTAEFPVDLGSTPLFVKSGAIISMTEDRLDNLKTQQAGHMRILCAADRDSRFELYEDDGISMDYEEGGCLKTSVTMIVGERTVLDFHQEGHYETAVKTLYLDMIYREEALYWVKVDGGTIPHFLYRGKFGDVGCGWYYSQRLKSVQIRYLNPKKDYQAITSFERSDLIGT